MRFFAPKQPVFNELFKNVDRDITQITSLFQELVKNFKDFEGYAKKAKELEHRGDADTYAIVDKLNKTFITPFDREDIYRLAGEMDDVIDWIEYVIHNIQIYRLTQNHPAFKEFAEIMVGASHCLTELLDCLEKLKHTEHLDRIKLKMHHLEDRGDEIFGRAIGELFQNHTDPIVVIKLKDILETLENVMDRFQQIGDIIQGIIVKSS